MVCTIEEKTYSFFMFIEGDLEIRAEIHLPSKSNSQLVIHKSQLVIHRGKEVTQWWVREDKVELFKRLIESSPEGTTIEGILSILNDNKFIIEILERD